MNIRALNGKILIAAALGIVFLAAAVYAASTVILAAGTIPDSALFGGSATVTVRTLTIQPGESLQWHYHPGYAFNVVKSGVLTVEDGCGGPEESLTPGQGFEEMEGHVHRAKNVGTDPVVVYNTFIMPTGQPTTINIPNNQQKCGPPSTVDDCLMDNWMIYNHPQAFESQGQCVKWVLHRPTVTVPAPY